MPINISIHALREEGDCYIIFINKKQGYFYPRPPRGGRHFIIRPDIIKRFISIHALREEGDRTGSR